jgi:hypothetical protein
LGSKKSGEEKIRKVKRRKEVLAKFAKKYRKVPQSFRKKEKLQLLIVVWRKK